MLARLFFGVIVIVALGSGCRGGCARDSHNAGSPVGPMVELWRLLPAESRIVVAIDVSRIRGSAIWKSISGVSTDAGLPGPLTQLVMRTGLNPVQDLQRALAAFPEEARSSGDFLTVFQFPRLDEKRLVAFVEDEAKLKGKTLQGRTIGKKQIWVLAGPSPLAGFVDGIHLAIGSLVWIEKAAWLAQKLPAPGPAALSQDGDLARLVGRVGPSRGLVLAAIVPDGTRRRLIGDRDLAAQASVMRLGGGLDLGPVLSGSLVAETTSAADARSLVDSFSAFLVVAKAHPQVLMLGAVPYLDGLTAKAEGPNARFSLALSDAATQEIAARLSALVSLGRQKLLQR